MDEYPHVELVDPLEEWEDALVRAQEMRVEASVEQEDTLLRLIREIKRRRERCDPSASDDERCKILEAMSDTAFSLATALNRAVALGDRTSVERGFAALRDFIEPQWWDRGGLDCEIWGEVLDMK